MLESNERTKLVLSGLTGVYRIFSLIAVFIIIISSGKEAPLTAFQITYLTFLPLCVLLYFVFNRYEKIQTVILCAEYFTVFFYAYVEPHYLEIELIWTPGIIAALALILHRRICPIVLSVAGIFGPFLFSYGSMADNISVTTGAHSLPYNAFALFLYAPVFLLSVMLNRIYDKAERTEKRYNDLDLDNKRLNDINHTISQRIFSLQNDTTQKERNRLSKEIHDTAGYVFINLIMMLQAAQAILYRDITKADKLVGDARDYAERGINEIRHLLQDIRSYNPLHLSLQNELHDIGDSFQKATGVEIDIEYGNWPKTISKEKDFFFISFMQEALTNALKHGHADKVSVFCWNEGGIIGMSVIDNGSGAMLPINKGIGIAAMEDVVNQLEGSITIKSDVGFKITASVPGQM